MGGWPRKTLNQEIGSLLPGSHSRNNQVSFLYFTLPIKISSLTFFFPLLTNHYVYSSLPSPWITFSWWLPETVGNTDHTHTHTHTHTVFPYAYPLMIKINLLIRHNERLITIVNTKNLPAMPETPVPREGTGYPLQYSWASLVAQLVKNSPVIRET